MDSSTLDRAQQEDVRSLLREAAECGLDLWVERGQLRYRSSTDPLAVALRTRLRTQQATLIDVLGGPRFSKRGHTPEVLHLPVHQVDWWNEVAVDQVNANATHLVFRLTGGFDPAKVASAMSAAFSRHDLLRTKADIRAGAPRLTFVPESPIPLVTRDVTGSSRAESELIGAMVWAPFDGGALFRSFVLRLSERVCVLGFNLHHFVGDIWSCWTLAREVLAEIQRRGGQTAGSTVRPLQYSDYLLGINDWLTGLGPKSALRYWKAKMNRALPVRIPEDYDVASKVAGRLCLANFQIHEDLRTRMVALARAETANLLTVILAAKFVALFRVLRRSDIVVTALFSGRDHSELVNTVGSTVILIPLRVLVTPELTFSNLLSRVDDTCIEARRHQVPWRLLMRETAQAGASPVCPLVNFIPAGSFDIANTADSAAESGGKIELVTVDKPPETGSVAWNSSHEMIVADYGLGMVGFIRYLSLRYESETIERFIAVFLDTLGRCTAKPHSPIGRLFEHAV
jgi:Condensation domain